MLSRSRAFVWIHIWTFSFSLITGGCALPWSSGDTGDTADPAIAPPARAEVGSVFLLSHGESLFVGGNDRNVRSVRVNGAGSLEPSSWASAGDLPVAPHGAALFVLGNFLYMAGGDDGQPSDRIFFTRIRGTDGTLGFGDSSRWEENPRSLPVGLSDMAWAVADGRVYLFGGRGMDGLGRTVYHAAVHDDGQIGNWYVAGERLPRPQRGGTVHVTDEALVVVGGVSGEGPLDTVVIFDRNEHGLPVKTRTERLPTSNARPIVAETTDGRLIVGGRTGDGRGHMRWFRREESSVTSEATWSPNTALGAVDAVGPHAVWSAAGLFYLSWADTYPTVRTANLAVAPPRPSVFPGSGIVPGGSRPVINHPPGTEVRYTSDSISAPPPPSPVDPMWQADNTVDAAGWFAFRAFNGAGESSPVQRVRYKSREAEGFIHSERLSVSSGGSSSHAQHAVGPGWYHFDLRRSGLTLRINVVTSDSLQLSAFESDLFTPVIADSQHPMFEVQVIDQRSMTISRPPDRIYLHVTGGDGYIELSSEEGGDSDPN